ncbi:hypothetical protein B0H12DRAFT_734745 [Mycena haematopus]|nr:hypothetical protein B0H12DRAFT_734745 [Mycena haematopus]
MTNNHRCSCMTRFRPHGLPSRSAIFERLVCAHPRESSSTNTSGERMPNQVLLICSPISFFHVTCVLFFHADGQLLFAAELFLYKQPISQFPSLSSRSEIGLGDASSESSRVRHPPE